MVCPTCGAQVALSTTQCQSCGQRLTPSGDEQTVLAGTPVSPEDFDRMPSGDPSLDSEEDRTVVIPTPPHKTPYPTGDDATRLAGDVAPGAADGPLAVGQAFGPRYHIIRLLGAGGMGAVYQAWDSELGVAVAIKVIRPEVMADATIAGEISRRFKRELLLARQVTHRNVVRIHDLGDIGNIKYITMLYVDGEDLATILNREGRLPVARTLKIARLVVEGLAEAHKADVVHRDLKPANIMIDAEDQPLIMDFGIARSTGRPMGQSLPGNTTIVGSLRRLEESVDATVLGAVVGTVGYMAPEQARGQTVDQRADIYALGLIVYDMLVGGSRAERAGGAMAELQARMQHAPPSMRTVVPEIPEAFDALVSKCLEPDPAKRYLSTQELADALDALDDDGNKRRVKRVVDSRLIAALLVVMMGMAGWTFWMSRGPEVPVQREPVSVLISDFQNLSDDPTFDGTLEQVVKVALEGADFITAYDRAGIRRSLGIRPPEQLDEAAAQEIAVKQGVNVILSGSVARRDAGYVVSMKAVQGVTGSVISEESNAAAGKDQVLGTATRLANQVRRDLGDNTSDEAQRFAMDTLSATSVEAVRDYAAGMVAISNSRFQEAHDKFASSVQQDPKFGMGWTALAMASFNLDKLQDTEKYVQEAMRHLDAMTERERYRTRGLFYLATSDYQQCVKEYGDLVARYAGDASAGNNLALCSSRLRKNAEAAEQMRQVVKILPNRALYRENLSLYLAYAGDFQGAEQEARKIEQPGVFGLLAVVFSQVGRDQLQDAATTYRQIGKIDEQGASYMAAGLGDLAVYEGRFAEAVRILEPAAAADVKADDPDRAATKFTALAYANLSQRRLAAAVAAAEQALRHSQIAKIRFLSARTFVEAGQTAKAQAQAETLAKELQPEPRAYARIIEGMLAVRDGRPRDALQPLSDANALLDTWIGRFELGRAYFEAGAYTQADSELDRCLARRGEALSLFLDEDPTYGYLPAVYYYLGRVREELKTAAFADSYRTYLQIRGSSDDPLVPEIRKRAGN